ncbi:MAG: hypothetical protein L0Z73_17380 [Gammaproteobacteria bacterium]|nr:hypothetical protein [Gammaproteobacteria bacterium]
MRGLQFYKKTVFYIFAVSSLATVLSGCLVENKEPPPLIDRRHDNLRMIQPGDRIVYDLSGTRTTSFIPSSISGTMTVTWSDNVIEDPHNFPDTIQVLREETVVEYDQGGGSTMIRYVTQQPDGSLFVHAYYDQAAIVYVGDLTTPPTYQPVEVVSSPLQMANSAISYRIQQCDTNQTSCILPSIKIINELNEYRGEVDLTIQAGRRYNTLFYSFTGSYLENYDLPIPIPLDYRTLCDANAIDFNGEYYYFPEVGLVEFFSSCTGFDANLIPIGHSIRGSLLSASFALP